MSPVGDVERAATIALAGLPKVGPARFRALVADAGTAEAAWAAVRAGRLHDVPLRAGARHAQLVADLRDAARAVEPADELARHRAAGVEVLLPGDPAWPVALVDDPDPPLALFARGELALLDEVIVAVVGTRRCSGAGARIAGTLGADLAAAGVAVVSGLALGIDGAAHRGALGAGGRPVGVVGSGLDVVYPPQHRRLWHDVADAGLLLSEAPLGRPPERWRFPARNRIIAALSDAVVVVESRRTGGSMTTVESALERDRPVMAVPGSVLAEQAAGTNQLLSEGATMVRDAVDVLGALACAPPRADDGPARVGAAPGLAGLPADGPVAAVAAALSPAPVGIEHLATSAGVAVAEALTALAHLEAAGVARRVPGGYEQVVG
ncbi:MAG: DNA-processing protein DprA [Acidimicrobiia bacterium]